MSASIIPTINPTNAKIPIHPDVGPEKNSQVETPMDRPINEPKVAPRINGLFTSLRIMANSPDMKKRGSVTTVAYTM